MRKLWVVALANLAVVGLVLTAIITNVVSACSSADGCGSAPPYIYVGLLLVLLGCVGLFLLFRKWRGASVTADSPGDSLPDSDDAAPKRKRSDKASRAELRDADAAAETSSRNRLGRIRGTAADDIQSTVDSDHVALPDGDDPMAEMSVDADVAVDWPTQIMADPADGWATDNGDDHGDDYGDDAVHATDAVSVDHSVEIAWPPAASIPGQYGDVGADAADDEEFGLAWAVDDVPAISPSKDDYATFNETYREPAITLPIMPDSVGAEAETGQAAASAHIRLDQIFAGPAAILGDDGEAETVPPVVAASAPVMPQRFDDCVPVGFPATVGDLRALIAVLSLDILLDKQARDEIAAWQSVLAPLDDGDAIGPEDCEAFAQWIDALAERHNADLATTVAHALQQRDGGGSDPIRSAA